MTLSDKEQRELYQAAQIIQKAFRSYKGRKQDPTSREVRDRSSSTGPGGLSEAEAEQNKEVKAASVIQNYYRRYKQVSLNTGVSTACTRAQYLVIYYYPPASCRRIFELFPRRTFYIFPFINLLGRNKLYESYIYFMFSCHVACRTFISY